MGTERTGPTEIRAARGVFPPDPLWDTATEYYFEAIYPGGVKLIISNKVRGGVTFEGSEGQVWANRGRHDATPKSILDSKIGPDEIQFPLKNEKRDFIDCVKARTQTMEDAEVGHRATSLCQLAYIACQTGERLRWDPDGERFLNSDAANKLLTRPPGREPWTV
jgi:hypothetical protein